MIVRGDAVADAVEEFRLLLQDVLGKPVMAASWDLYASKYLALRLSVDHFGFGDWKKVCDSGIRDLMPDARWNAEADAHGFIRLTVDDAISLDELYEGVTIKLLAKFQGIRAKIEMDRILAT